MLVREPDDRITVQKLYEELEVLYLLLKHRNRILIILLMIDFEIFRSKRNIWICRRIRIENSINKF